MKRLKVGVMGGTFDPPHIGHQILAAEALEQLQLDQVLWLLTPHPPHKPFKKITSTYERIIMVELAIAANDQFVFSKLDLERDPPHYAVDTMRLLHERAPLDEYYYLMGLDSLNDLLEWHEPAEFVRQCDQIVVMLRYGESLEISSLVSKIPELKNKLFLLNTPSIEISSSDIRLRSTSRRQFRYFLPDSVYNYIVDNHLYQS